MWTGDGDGVGGPGGAGRGAAPGARGNPGGPERREWKRADPGLHANRRGGGDLGIISDERTLTLTGR